MGKTPTELGQAPAQPPTPSPPKQLPCQAFSIHLTVRPLIGHSPTPPPPVLIQLQQTTHRLHNPQPLMQSRQTTPKDFIQDQCSPNPSCCNNQPYLPPPEIHQGTFPYQLTICPRTHSCCNNHPYLPPPEIHQGTIPYQLTMCPRTVQCSARQTHPPSMFMHGLRYSAGTG